MTAVKKSDIPEVSNFMSDFWVFIKSVWIPEDSDDYCNTVHQGARELLEKYPDSFCRGQVLRFLDYIDDKWRDKK